MKAKRITGLLMALTLTIALSACGNIEPVQESTIETEELKDVGIDVEYEVVTEDIAVVEDEAVAEDKAITEDEIVVEETTVEETAVANETVSATQNTSTAQAATAPAQTTDRQTATTAQTATTTTQNTSTAQTAPTASTPAHEHSWKEHTATTQKWVPNIVVVDDYETKYTSYGVATCYCGYETTDSGDLERHIENHISAGEIELAGFGMRTESSTEQVKVGSHEEDHGHYETSTYIDYYYCDCGATK